MFNPNPQISLIPIPDSHPCIVIDDFLINPKAMIEGAQRFWNRFNVAPHNAFPGLEMRMPEDFSALLNDFFLQHVRGLLGARRVLSMYSRLSMVTLQPHELGSYQRICHRDRLARDPGQCTCASVLYLFENSQLGGTSFYQPKLSQPDLAALFSQESSWHAMQPTEVSEALGTTPGYQTSSNNYFDLVLTVAAKFNRIIFYDGSIFHSSHIAHPELLVADPLQGRLTLNGFFTCRRNQ